MHEVGLQDRENSRLYTKKPRCDGRTSGSFVTVGIVDIEPALKFVFLGIATSLLVFFFELMMHYLINLKKRDQRNSQN